MTIEKCKDFVKDGYGTWDDTSKPTTFANMYDFMKNQNNVTLALAKGLWQPNTAYVVGDVVRSPSLPAGCKATCTTAGTTGSTEPKWTAYGTTVTDGTVKWAVETDVQGTMDGEITKAITSAINSLHNTIKSEITKTLSDTMHAQYPVGSYIYSDKSDNPATYLPYMSDTTWVQTAAGRVLIGAGTADSGTVYNAGDTGGEEKHKITVEELAAHLHEQRINGDGNDGWKNVYGEMVTLPNEGGTQGRDGYACKNAGWTTGANIVCTGRTGGNQPHNNMQPYSAVYIFKRSS